MEIGGKLMGLRMKVLSGFLVLTLMLLIAGVWSVYELSSAGTSVQRLLDDNYKSINAAKNMVDALEREDNGLLLLLSGKQDQGRSIIESADSRFQQEFNIAQNNVTILGEQANIDAIESRYKTYKDLWMKAVVDTSTERKLNWYFKEAHQAFLNVKSYVEKLMTLNDKTMYQTASNLKKRAHRAIMPGIVAILSAFVFSIIFNYFISYYFVNPVIQITKGLQKFIKTGEPLNVKTETKDELSALVTSIQQLVARSMDSKPTK